MTLILESIALLPTLLTTALPSSTEGARPATKCRLAATPPRPPPSPPPLCPPPKALPPPAFHHQRHCLADCRGSAHRRPHRHRRRSVADCCCHQRPTRRRKRTCRRQTSTRPVHRPHCHVWPFHYFLCLSCALSKLIPTLFMFHVIVRSRPRESRSRLRVE